MSDKDAIQEYSLDEIFGDVNLESARKIYEAYWSDPGSFEDSLAVTLQKRIVDDALDMIDHRTGQQNDARYMSYVLEWALTGSDLGHEFKINPNNVSLIEKINFVRLDFLVTQSHSPELAKDDWQWNLFTDGMYEDLFGETIQTFGG